MRVCKFSPLILVLVILAVSWNQSSAQSGNPDPDEQAYFTQTGHTVTREFLQFYNSVPNAEKILGYPITEAYMEQTQGRIVQYFENVRLDLSPDAPAELQVVISPLGYYSKTDDEPLPVPSTFPACQYFPETRFQVCYAFLDFFEANGGAALFGYPLSNFVIQDKRIIQHFQRARFEWHPELPAGKRVTLAPLGRIHFDTIGENPQLLLPIPYLGGASNLPQLVLDLRVRAFTRNAVLPAQGEQIVNIIVQDQKLLPIPGAEVEIEVHMPSGKVDTIRPVEKTDKNGILSVPYSFSDEPNGVAQFFVTAHYESLVKQTRTSFWVWW